MLKNIKLRVLALIFVALIIPVVSVAMDSDEYGVVEHYLVSHERVPAALFLKKVLAIGLLLERLILDELRPEETQHLRASLLIERLNAWSLRQLKLVKYFRLLNSMFQYVKDFEDAAVLKGVSSTILRREMTEYSRFECILTEYEKQSQRSDRNIDLLITPEFLEIISIKSEEIAYLKVLLQSLMA